ncbi:fumarylacetoacetate hydrolase family protein [Bordetella sp. 15P40C-2]|uniref:fumarylacetoacetate hydrolase family protein n=1 Tax=Bordetella sp. 15P40C-2 TaxID=2572246 RepID=UPI0013220830|nr:fumarylacetoacetate hydrolase family protein [Bordetella sp. 15P40C-2]MVW73154.1 2-hydroxyhepta-2,4-diene-1,7-dioate isomerase [Bordetella sp. 15P40C-2]
MKLVRYGERGEEKPGILAEDGSLRDLSGALADITPDTLSIEGIDRLRQLDATTLPEVKQPVRFGVPLNGISKIIAVGLNYSDHAKEAGMPIPVEPILFTKAISSLNGPDDDVIIPKASTKVDWEVELGIVIGKRAKSVSEAQAMEYVAGYCLVNDVSERELQLERGGGQWDKGKGLDTFCPVGPWLVTADEVADVQALDLWLDVNGVHRQTGNTATMIFGVQYLVHYISQYVTLMPGDLIITGTPPGVGMGMKPAVFLQHGDMMELGIEGLGVQRQKVVRAA